MDCAHCSVVLMANRSDRHFLEPGVWLRPHEAVKLIRRKCADFHLGRGHIGKLIAPPKQAEYMTATGSSHSASTVGVARGSGPYCRCCARERSIYEPPIVQGQRDQARCTRMNSSLIESRTLTLLARCVSLPLPLDVC